MRGLLAGGTVRPLRALVANAGTMSADTRLARPATGGQAPGMTASGVASSNAKPALLYYAHELQRHVAAGIAVSVFEPGWMPGTALGRGAPAPLRAVSRALGRVPGVSTPQRSGPLLAAMAVGDEWAHPCATARSW